MRLKGSAENNSVLRGKLSGLATIHGYSAYEVAVINGFKGTEEEWLETLHGNSAYEIAVLHGFKGTEEEWLSAMSNGKIPVKGVDYYTAEDKEEMVNLVLEELPTWEGGSY